MSKSLGTGMNPIANIEAHGADATRYGLMKMASSQDVAFSEGDTLEGRKLANKLWNASRLLLQAGVSEVAARPTALEERWILARLSQTQCAVEASLNAFDFSHLVQELYHLTFDDFCDWYLEAIKPRVYAGEADALATAGAALERILKLLHPAIPHVTEEISSNLPGRDTRPARRVRRATARLPRNPRRRHERQVDGDPTGSRLPGASRLGGRLLHVSPRLRLERADPSGRRRR